MSQSNILNGPSAEPDDEVLRIFLLGRGHKAMRAYIRHSRDDGWPRANCRFVLEALYSRFGQIVRSGADLDDLLRLRRVLQELLTECAGAPPDFKVRIEGISELISDFINQEGGAHNAAIFEDPIVARIVTQLEAGQEIEEAALIEAVESREAFIQAISTLIVADLVTFSETGDDGYAYKLSIRGRNRLRYQRGGDPLRELHLEPEDLHIWTPVQPIFDLMILPFAQAIVDCPELQTSPDARLLPEFGIDIDPALMERPLQDWYNSDETFLVPRSQRRRESYDDIGAITLPRVRISSMAAETSVDVAVGNAFFGFHLLVDREALSGLVLPRKVPAFFPVDVSETRSIVEWREFGAWLKDNDLKAKILGDRATNEFFTELVRFSPGADGRVEHESVESNSGRLDRLRDRESGVLTLAVATGPLLAIARSAGFSILTTSWSILGDARDAGLTYETASRLVFKQYMWIGVAKRAFESNEKAEDAVYRAMKYTETAYRLIVAHPDQFATYCASQWDELQKTFSRSEFRFTLNVKDIEFALATSYRWLGQDLSGLQPSDNWPVDRTGLQSCSYWTSSEARAAVWPSILVRRAKAEARIDDLAKRAAALLPLYETTMRGALKSRVQHLKQIGCLRQAERALMATIENLRALAATTDQPP